MGDTAAQLHNYIINYGPTVSPIISVLLAACLSYYLYFKQQRTDKIKKAHVDDGIYTIIYSINKAILISSHNWHQALNLLKPIRDNEDVANCFEFNRYFKHLDETSLNPIEHHRLNKLIGTTVFSSLHQHCHADMTSYYHSLIHDFYDIVYKVTRNEATIENKDEFITISEKLINSKYDDIKKYTKAIDLLLDLADVAERSNLNRLSNFKNNKNVVRIISEAEKMLKDDNEINS